MQKKFEVSSRVTLIVRKNGKEAKVFRIKALRDIPRYDVCAGDWGGYVESEANLSHEGNSWIADNAVVEDNAIVRDNAIARGQSRMSDCAELMGEAAIYDNVRLSGHARVADSAELRDKTVASDRAFVRNNVVIVGQSTLTGDCWINDSVYLKDVTVGDTAFIDGNVRLKSARIMKDACIKSHRTFCSLNGIGDYTHIVTAYKTRTHGIVVDGLSLEEFEIFFRERVDCRFSDYNTRCLETAINLIKQHVYMLSYPSF